MMSLEAKIEAVLFYRAEPVKRAELEKILGVDQTALGEALERLKMALPAQGLTLLELGEELELGTAPELSELIEQLAKEELAKELGKAGLETLTLIAYEGPISRPEIDQVRGVNSSFILRNLMVRGLVERVVDKKDSRRYLYQPTMELLRYLGLEKLGDLPEYDQVQDEIKKFLDNHNDKTDGESTD